MTEAQNGRAMTEGEYRVGISFNPSGNGNVDDIKRKAADLIDLCQTFMDTTDSPAAKRCAAVAMTEIESAAMWAVKAVTKQAR